MNRRSFIKQLAQSIAIIGALKLGLGNLTAEDVKITDQEKPECYRTTVPILTGHNGKGVRAVFVNGQLFTFEGYAD